VQGSFVNEEMDMKLKVLMGTMAAAVLFSATPALADRGHGHGKWKKQHHAHQYRYYERHVYHHYPPVRVYQRQYPRYHVYTYAPPPPGVHIVLPNVYIPLR
jgi:hypothetical protein